MSMGKSAAIIINPTSGGPHGDRLALIVSALRNKGIEPAVMKTAAPGDATRLAREASRSGHTMVIAAGGDGTYNEVANGLAGADMPMALMPMGTTNVLCREVGIPFDPAQAMERALNGAVHRVSLGKAITSEGDRLFCLMAGVGFDAEVVHNINLGLKRRTGKLAYVVKAVQTLAKWSPAKALKAMIDGKVYECYSAIICKGGKYAGDFTLAPDASLTDPYLHAYLVTGRGRTDIARLAMGLVTGGADGSRSVKHIKATEVAVLGNSPIQLDGDPHLHTPASFTVERDCLNLIW